MADHVPRLASAGTALVLAMAAATTTGTVDLPLSGVVRSLADALPFVHVHDPLDPVQHAVLWDIRLPRVVLAAMVGAALSLAGASYQGVFRNPLVDPYLLGSAAGAGLGATIAIAYLHNDTLTAPFAFVGALGAVALAWIIGATADRQATATVLLAGVAVMSFLTAAQTFLQQRRAASLQTVYAWILGHLTTAGWTEVQRMLPYLTVSSIILLAHRRALDVLATGDDKARSLGLAVDRVRVSVIAAASLATAAAVATSGLIGFVGLIVPHVVRRLFGSAHGVVLPLTLVVGATFLVIADLLARTALAPAELPIGVVTAFVGAPFFIVVLRRTRHALS